VICGDQQHKGNKEGGWIEDKKNFNEETLLKKAQWYAEAYLEKFYHGKSLMKNFFFQKASVDAPNNQH
jgi:hypothetical protein